MNDYTQIKILVDDGGDDWLIVDDTNSFHEQDSRWLFEQIQLARAAKETVLVISHHAPTFKVLNSSSLYDNSKYAYATNLEQLMGDPVAIWVYGHSHYSMDINVRGTRVISNQMGYPSQNLKRFDPKKIFEIGLTPEKQIDVTVFEEKVSTCPKSIVAPSPAVSLISESGSVVNEGTQISIPDIINKPPVPLDGVATIALDAEDILSTDGSDLNSINNHEGENKDNKLSRSACSLTVDNIGGTKMEKPLSLDNNNNAFLLDKNETKAFFSNNTQKKIEDGNHLGSYQQFTATSTIPISSTIGKPLRKSMNSRTPDSSLQNGSNSALSLGNKLLGGRRRSFENLFTIKQREDESSTTPSVKVL